MKVKIKKNPYGYTITLIPENEKDNAFLNDWDYHTEIFMTSKGTLKIMI